MPRTINYDTARQVLEALAQKAADDIGLLQSLPTFVELENQVLCSSLRMYRAGVLGSLEMLEAQFEAERAS